MGMEAKLLYIPNISEMDETKVYNPISFNRDKIPYLELNLIRICLFKKFIFNPFQFFQYLINSERIKSLLIKEKPNIVVIGSHLGQMYIRQIQIFCHHMRIPIVSMWITSDMLNEKQVIPKSLQKLLRIDNVMNWSHYNDFMRSHLFVTTGNVLKTHMETIGIPEQQIKITGNPTHDYVFNYISKKNDGQMSVFKKNEIKPGERYLVFLTECIQLVFDTNYLVQLLNELKIVFNQLPSDIKVVIKFHPREPEEIRCIYRSILCNELYIYSNTDLIPLLLHAELSFSHFSRAIETSLAIGTICLSINLSRNDKYSFFHEEPSKIFEVQTIQEFEKKLKDFFNNLPFREQLEEARVKWIRENIYTVDGKNSLRMAEAIIEHKVT
jgi:hypothetical protein